MAKTYAGVYLCEGGLYKSAKAGAKLWLSNPSPYIPQVLA